MSAHDPFPIPGAKSMLVYSWSYGLKSPDFIPVPGDMLRSDSKQDWGFFTHHCHGNQHSSITWVLPGPFIYISVSSLQLMDHSLLISIFYDLPPQHIFIVHWPLYPTVVFGPRLRFWRPFPTIHAIFIRRGPILWCVVKVFSLFLLWFKSQAPADIYIDSFYVKFKRLSEWFIKI